MLSYLAQSFRFWPEQTLSEEQIALIPWILLVLFTVFGLLYFYRYSRNRLNRLWESFLSYALKKGVDPEEIKILRTFFSRLNDAHKEEVIFNHHTLHTLLFRFLNENRPGDWRDRVELMDKLFQSEPTPIPIRQLEDLNPGEVCSIQLGEEHFLVTVIQEREDGVLLSLPRGKLSTRIQGSDTRLYAYHSHKGAYLIPVQISALWKNALLVKQNGTIEFRSEEHLVSQLEMQVEIHPWPLVPPGEGKQKEGGKETPDTSPPSPEVFLEEQEKRKEEPYRFEIASSKEKLIPLYGKSIKVSDRALLLELEEDYTHLYNRRQEIWEIHLTPPEGERPITCRGSLFPAPGQYNKYIFKFIDLPERDRDLLFELLRKHRPMRGHLV